MNGSDGDEGCVAVSTNKIPTKSPNGLHFYGDVGNGSLLLLFGLLQ